jgi:hypothetical protein
MRGHGRSQSGVASLAYDPRIHVFLRLRNKTWMRGSSPRMTPMVAMTPRQSPHHVIPDNALSRVDPEFRRYWKRFRVRRMRGAPECPRRFSANALPIVMRGAPE